MRGTVNLVACLALVALVVLVALAGPARAQEVTEFVFTSAPSPVGAGARAAGIGNAFIAVADDASATSWNPGGLVQLERPEMSAVFRYSAQIDDLGPIRVETPSIISQSDAGLDTTHDPGLNYLSMVLPFTWRDRAAVIALNYQEMLSFDRDITFRSENRSVETGLPTTNAVARVKQFGKIYAISPAMAVNLTPEWSLGLAVNYWWDGLGRSYAWRRESRGVREFPSRDQDPTVTDELQSFENVRGVNATFGGLLRFDRWSAGLVAEVPFKLDFRRKLTLRALDPVVGSTSALTMSLPASLGLGLAWRISDQRLLSLDVTHVWWSEFEVRDPSGNRFLLTGDPIGSTTVRRSDESFSVDDITTVRLGFEQVVASSRPLVSLRGGAFWDPEPARGGRADFWGASLGIGVTLPRLSFDVAYQVRVGLGVSDTAILLNAFNAPDTEIDQYSHSVLASVVVYL